MSDEYFEDVDDGKFECVNCGKMRPEKQRVFEMTEWCNKCYKEEGKRSVKEDRNANGLFDRIPRYMIQPKDYEKYGYPKYVKPS